jgi:hypothetical protein
VSSVLKKTSNKEKLIIGRVEAVRFVEFDIGPVEAKVDTGAYSSSIHCFGVEEKEGTLYFSLMDPHQPKKGLKIIHTSEYTETVVKSSNGERQKRYKINTLINIGGKRFKTVFTLAGRDNMKYSVLLGRKAIQKRFLVDVTKKFILNKENQVK